MYDKLKKQVLSQLIPSHARILVAVSGGPDSVALGHILWRYACDVKEDNISLVLTHVHHGVRKESDEEEKMVIDLARKWGIPYIVHHFDSKSYAKALGQSFQTAARMWRYTKWKEDMAREECTLLATAHHLGDQAETVLYRMLRGSGTAGLAGIYPQKGEVIRPFLSISKGEILEYCRKEQLPYAFDQSNAEPIYVRNKIRLELLPELERNYNPRVQEALGRAAELLRWDEEYLSKVSESAWSKYAFTQSLGQVGLRREVFQESPAILSRLIRMASAKVTGEPRGIGFSYVGQIMDSRGQIGWSQDLPGLNVHIDYDGIWFRCFRRSDDDQVMDTVGALLSIPVRFGEWVQWDDPEGRTCKMGLFKEESNILPILNELNDERAGIDRVTFDRGALEQVEDSLVWRNRQPGDTMWFSGVGHKTLKKIFQEAKMGRERRMTIPLLAFGDEVLWIPGIRRSDRYLVSSGEKAIGIIVYKELKKMDVSL